MGRARGATNTEKTIILVLSEGWSVRYVDGYGWSLFRPGWSRPFARVKDSAIEHMTDAGWLTAGTLCQGLAFRPAKDLTPLGRRYAQRLRDEQWATAYEWTPLDRELEDDAMEYRKAA